MATTLVKTTLDGRRLEVVGLAICLDGALEAFELIEVKQHPNCAAIYKAAPDATHMAGRVPLTRQQVDIVVEAFKMAEAQKSRKPRCDQRKVSDRHDVEGARTGHRIDVACVGRSQVDAEASSLGVCSGVDVSATS